MGWSYTPGDTDRDKVRRLIGDVHSDDPLITDEEIDVFLIDFPNPYRAAAESARSIAAEFSRDVSVSFEGTSLQGQRLAENWFKLADTLDAQTKNNSLPSDLQGSNPTDYAEDHEENIFEIAMDDNKGQSVNQIAGIGGG